MELAIVDDLVMWDMVGNRLDGCRFPVLLLLAVDYLFIDDPSYRLRRRRIGLYVAIRPNVRIHMNMRIGIYFSCRINIRLVIKTNVVVGEVR